jgi:hypothetical protein
MEKIVNIKMPKTVGIISSIILILNYLINASLFESVNGILLDLIFTTGFVTFYFAISRYMQLYSYKVEARLVKAIIIVEILSLVLQILHYYSPNLSGFLLYISPVIIVVLFMFFGIKTLKIRNNSFHGLEALKCFIVFMFIAYIFVAIGILVLTTQHKLNLINWVFTIYAVPYIFGLVFFIKLNFKNQQDSI